MEKVLKNINKFFQSKQGFRLLIYCVLIVSFVLRIYGLNWDQNQHLHPDERFLTMVTSDIKWSGWSNYLNPVTSTMNPYNVGYGFFVYGMLPLYVVKFFSNIILFDLFAYNNIALVGRVASAFFDMGSVVVVYYFAKQIFDKRIGILAMLFYGMYVLPIQQSHFFTTDSFSVFLSVSSVYFCYKYFFSSKGFDLFSSAMFLGLALATKLSSLYILPIVVFCMVGRFLSVMHERVLIRKWLLDVTVYVVLSYLVLRVFDPRIFISRNIFQLTLNPIFVENLKQLKSFSDPSSYFPPGIQWISTKAIIFPLKNIIFYGLGVFMGGLGVVFVIYGLIESIREYAGSIFKKGGLKKLMTSRDGFYNFIIIWIFVLFVYQGIQFVKALRYFYVIYPFIAVVSAKYMYRLYNNLSDKKSVIKRIYFPLIVIASIWWPASFISIYSDKHTRIDASSWIYENIPKGSVISCEHWDDCLPLPLDGQLPSNYKIITLEMFNPDTSQKWQKINEQLNQVDYLILSSNRLWGSIPKVPNKYPTSSRFYQDLLEENLNFIKIAEFTSYPKGPMLNLEFVDDGADETFTVYDHPKVMIFKKI